MKVQIITLFPKMFDDYFSQSMMWKAQKERRLKINVIDLRKFGLGSRRQVDDAPYGGGDGMVLMIEPLLSAIKQAKDESPSAKVILPTPRGNIYKQSDAKRLASEGNDLIIVCPRYEGYDERITQWVDEQFCIGSYVLTGGELPAMIITDSVVRLLPGVLGGETSAENESFMKDDKTIESPQYTRPEEFKGIRVPEILLSGRHADIEKWRQKNQK